MEIKENTVEGRISTLKDKDGLVKLPVTVDSAVVVQAESYQQLDSPVLLKDVLENIAEECRNVKEDIVKLNKDIEAVDIKTEGLIEQVEKTTQRLDGRIDDTIDYIELVEEELTEKIETTEKELTAEIKKVEEELTAEIEKTKEELTEKIETVEKELSDEIQDSVMYVRTEPTITSVGSLKPGITFNGTIQEALDRIFYPPVIPAVKFSLVPNSNMENGNILNSIVLKLEITNKHNADLVCVKFYRGNALLNEINIEDSSIKEFTFTETNQITTTTSFSAELLYVSDGANGNTGKQAGTINYMNKVYWGAFTQSNLDSNFILGLEGSKLVTSNNIGKVNVTLEDGEYFYYALPSSFSKPNFTDSTGFAVGMDDQPTEIQFTNSYGFTTAYKIWKSTRSGLGTLTITIN